MNIAIRRLALALLVLAPVTLTSCVESPREMLIGRWYNRANSIRFEANGAIDWNSTTGRAKGIFYYDTKAKRAQANEPMKNLVVKMQQGDTTIYGEYEIHYMSGDRMRLTRLNGPQRSSGSLTILKRADPNEEKKTAATQVAVSGAR
jgi:hypothetical protein